MRDQSFFEVRVERYLQELMPDYLCNRQKEVDELSRAVEKRDFDRMASISHRMIGVGTPFGFAQVTELARRLRAAAVAKDSFSFSSVLAEYREYVSRVRVVYE